MQGNISTFIRSNTMLSDKLITTLAELEFRKLNSAITPEGTPPPSL